MAEQHTSEIDWATLVNGVEPRPVEEISYQFSNGRKFTEPFIPEGHGVYDDED